MADHRGERATRVDADGVRITPRGGMRRLAWLVALAIGIPVVTTVLAIVVIRWRTGRAAAVPTPPERLAAALAEPPPAPSSAAPPSEAAPGAPAAPARRATLTAGVHPRLRAAAPRAEATPARTKPEVDARDAILALRAEGETGGIAAFGLPGDDPPKPGIIVPEGYELPEGFVRHYQTTDDGEQLPAILMVHPDYDLVDADGRPVAAADRIVPPELAPPGLPIEILDVPARRTKTSEPGS